MKKVVRACGRADGHKSVLRQPLLLWTMMLRQPLLLLWTMGSRNVGRGITGVKEPQIPRSRELDRAINLTRG